MSDRDAMMVQFFQTFLPSFLLIILEFLITVCYCTVGIPRAQYRLGMKVGVRQHGVEVATEVRVFSFHAHLGASVKTFFHTDFPHVKHIQITKCSLFVISYQTELPISPVPKLLFGFGNYGRNGKTLTR